MSVEVGDAAAASARQPRKRVRGLLTSLQQQIEFYFGDANLQKDRFLQQQMRENEGGYIPIKVIASFNRMKELTSDLSLILQAIRNSSLVELSEDGDMLRRCVPLQEIAQTDVDCRTIYVEKLPSQPSVDHNYIRKLFSAFGNVLYTSLPRHKVSGSIKGFAFIEFSSPQEAQAAIEYFRSGTKPPPTPVAKTAPQLALTLMDGQIEEMATGPRVGEKGEGKGEEEGEGKGRKEEEEVARMQEATEHGGSEGEDVEGGMESRGQAVEGGMESRGQAVEEHRQQSQGQAAEEVEGGRDSQGVAEEGVRGGVESRGEAVEEKGSRKRNRTDSGEEGEEGRERKSARLESQSSEFPGGEGSGEGRKKKNRQHKKRDKWAALKGSNLRVMAKTEWLEMKELYRQMQKEQMRQLKSQSHEEGEGTLPQGKETKPFLSHCLLRVECVDGEGGAITVHRLREMCSKYGEIAYVDFSDGSKEGYVRYGTSGCVERAVQSESSTGVKLSVVSEEEERAYFLRTQASRKQARKLKSHKNLRGREKVVTRALQRQRGGRGGGEGGGGRGEGGGGRGRGGGGGGVKKVAEHIRFSDSDNET